MNLGKICKTKIWWKCKTLFYGERDLCCSCKNIKYWYRFYRRCWNDFWDFKFCIRQSLTKKNNKKLYEKMKDELDGKTMKPFVGLRAKTYSYSKDNNDED